MGVKDKLTDNVLVKSLRKLNDIAMANKALAIFLLLIFLIVGSVAGYKGTRWMETPQFCEIAICHPSMNPYSTYFVESAHGQAQIEYQCMECHGETRVGPLENKYLGVLLSHAVDSAPAGIATIEGKKPETEFDPLYPTVPSERCLRCHASDADHKDAFPVTAEDHSSPIDVSEMFQWTIDNPRGNKYVCKNCHSFITHPTDTELLPTERSEEFGTKHPGFPKIDLGQWQQVHLHLLRDGGKPGKDFVYTGTTADGDTYRVSAYKLEINGVERKLDHQMCIICHKVENLRPENLDAKCQGCHNGGIVTLFEHEPHWHVPNPNDYIGTKGVVGGPIAGGEAVDTH